MGECEDVQADRVAAGCLVVADKPCGIQRAQDVIGGAAMEARGAGDRARMQRPLRGVLGVKALCLDGRVLSNPLVAARPFSRLLKHVALYTTT
jgi:hypothetical protein